MCTRGRIRASHLARCVRARGSSPVPRGLATRVVTSPVSRGSSSGEGAGWGQEMIEGPTRWSCSYHRLSLAVDAHDLRDGVVLADPIARALRHWLHVEPAILNPWDRLSD